MRILSVTNRNAGRADTIMCTNGLQILILAFPLFLYSLAFAHDVCYDSTLQTDIKSDLGYREREPGVRSEGLYDKQVTSPELEVVSFTCGTLNYTLSAHELVNITVPPVPGIDTDHIHIRALRIFAGNPYYQMDGLLKRGKSFVWPMDDVLYRLGFGDQQIGIYGWTGASEIERTYIPVSASPKTKTPDANRETIILVVRFGINAGSVHRRLSGPGIQSEYVPIIESSYQAETPIRIAIPKNVSGVMFMEFALLGESGWQYSRIRLGIPISGDQNE